MSLSSGSPGRSLVLDAVEDGHEHGREEQVGIGGAVGTAVLDPPAPGAGAVDRDADDGRAVAAAVGDLGRGLEARRPAACSCWSWDWRRRRGPGRA